MTVTTGSTKFNNHWHWNVSVTNADDLLTDHIACPRTGPEWPKDPIAISDGRRSDLWFTHINVSGTLLLLMMTAFCLWRCCCIILMESIPIWVTLLPISMNISILAVAIYHVCWGTQTVRKPSWQHTMRPYTHCSEYLGLRNCVFIN